jgi:hypothetical protein
MVKNEWHTGFKGGESPYNTMNREAVLHLQEQKHGTHSWVISRRSTSECSHVRINEFSTLDPRFRRVGSGKYCTFLEGCLQIVGDMRDPHAIPSTLLTWFSAGWLFSFPKLKIAMKGTRFQADSSIHQIVVREMKAIREEVFSQACDSLYEQCKWVKTVLSDGVNNCFLIFPVWFLWP